MRFHLFPFRTEKLSSLTPMVLRFSRGRVGSRLFKPDPDTGSGFLFLGCVDTSLCMLPAVGAADLESAVPPTILIIPPNLPLKREAFVYRRFIGRFVNRQYLCEAGRIDSLKAA